MRNRFHLNIPFVNYTAEYVAWRLLYNNSIPMVNIIIDYDKGSFEGHFLNCCKKAKSYKGKTNFPNFGHTHILKQTKTKQNN